MMSKLFSNRTLRSRSPVFDTVEIKSVTYFAAFFIGYITFSFVKNIYSAIALLCFLIIIFCKNFKYLKPLISVCLILIFISGYLVGYFPYNNVVKKYENLHIEEFEGAFKVISDIEHRDSSIRFKAKITAGELKNEKVLLTLYETSDHGINRNSTYIIKDLTIAPVLPYNIEKQILNVSSSFKDGIYLSASGENVPVEKIKDGYPGIAGFFSKIKEKLNIILSKHLDKNQFDFVSGVLTGYKDYNNEDFNRILGNTGISHVVVVSGMHFSILMFIILAILRFFYVSVQKASLITLVLSFVVALFFGITPSVLRALIITDLLLLADIFSRDRSASLHFLMITADIMIILNPMIIYDIGFVLSFSSVLGISIFYNKIDKLLNFVPLKLRDIMSVSLSANIITLPLIALYFNTLSLGFLLGNLIITPLIAVIMLYSVLSIIVCLIYSGAGGVMFSLLNYIISILFIPLKFISDINFLHYNVIKPSFTTVIIFYSLIATLIIFEMNKKKYIKCIIFTASIFYIGLSLFISDGYPIINPTSYYALGGMQSGKAIITKSGKTIVLDLSESDESYDLKTILTKKCRSKVDLYVICNEQSLNALYEISDDIKVARVLYPSSFEDNIIMTEKVSNTADEYENSNNDEYIELKDLKITPHNDIFGNILSVDISDGDSVVSVSRDLNVIPENTSLNIISYKKLKYLDNNCIDAQNIINGHEEKLYLGSVK